MKVIKFPQIEKGVSRYEFKKICKDIIDRLEGDFSLSFRNDEDIFYESPECDTVIVTTDKEKHKAMNGIFKNKYYYTQREE